MIIKKFKDFILEKKTVDDYDSEYIGLIEKDKNSFGSNIKYLTLYDFKNNNVLAYSEINDILVKGDYEAHMIYAEKGLGYLISDFTLMSVYPNPLIPSKTIKPKALSIFKKYYENRDDVVKVDMNHDDESYSDFYTNITNGEKLTDSNLKFLNCYYYLEKSSLYNELINKGEKLMLEYNLNPSKISNMGYKKYDLNYIL